jgi:asparagine synthase (glutamine-hydrolysing)
MCGIWASINLEASRAAIDIIAHRGPDGDGWKDFATPAGRLSFGHRRLAIIATNATGLQPLEYEDGRYWIVFNGEIYNYRELRDELAEYGRHCRTLTDTEVILASYAVWGESCLQKFNGMFAFALYDKVTDRLLLARDRFGVKPLYLYETDRGFAVASEIKQFSTVPGFKAALNRPRLRDFFLSGVIDHTAETFFGGVRQLRGGEFVHLDLGRWRPGQRLVVERWHDMPSPDTIAPSLDEAVARFDALMRDSVKLRLRADVSVGSCLSGGLDSSTIVCLANEVRGGDTGLGHHTFTCAFDDPGLDEWSYAKEVIDQCGNESHVVRPQSGDLWSAIDDMIWHQDEPFGSTSIFAQWSVFKEAHAQDITVMLDGQGADETLAGYHTTFGAVLAGHVERGDMKHFWSDLKAMRRRHNTPIDRLMLLAAASAPQFQPLLPLVRAFIKKVEAEPLWVTQDLLNDDLASYQAATNKPRPNGATPLGHLCSVQLLNTSVPMLLHFEDRNSMAHSIEARVPFLDYRLVEFAIALGDLHKVVDGETKILLRRAMQNVLPKRVQNRQDKLGFPTPEQRWFRGELKEQVRAECQRTVDRFPDIFDGVSAKATVDRVLDGSLPFSTSPWRILCFGRWVDRFGVSV